MKIFIFRQDFTQIYDEMTTLCFQPLNGVYSNGTHDKISRDIATFAVRDKAIGELRKEYPNVEPYVFKEAFTQLSRKLIAEKAIQEMQRVDGRTPNDIRPIGCQVDLHEPLHGSALFQRGQTQVMCTVSLDALESALKSDAISLLMG